MKIWIVEKSDYGEFPSCEEFETLGLFSTREKAEKFVSRKFPDWKQHFTNDYGSTYEPSKHTDTRLVNLHSMVLDSEDE